MDSIEKKIIVQSLFEKSKQIFHDLVRLQKEAQLRANEAEGAMISRYDTFKEEGQYLANALKIRCIEAEQSFIAIENFMRTVSLDRFNRIKMFTYTVVEFNSGEKRNFFISPTMAGEVINNITIITPLSPIGQALMGKETGDEFHFYVNGEKKDGEILEVI